MKILIIGGTGTISSAVVREALAQGHELTVLNRGRRGGSLPAKVESIKGDINHEEEMAKLLEGRYFDTVCQFVVFTPGQIERDVRLFRGLTDQYIFISSASAYEKPPRNFLIDESTPLDNPFWEYSRKKQACEETLRRLSLETGLGITIVRPSHTYGPESIPVAIHGENGSYPVIRRILDGKPVILPGDGTSLWTFTWNTDFARAFVGLFGHPQAIGQSVHITSDESLTWNQAYEIIGRVVGRKPQLLHVATDTLIRTRPDLEGPLLGDKSNSVVFDNRKIKMLVPGWRAVTRYDEGVRSAWAYIQAHPELHREDPDFDRWCDDVAQAAGKFGG